MSVDRLFSRLPFGHEQNDEIEYIQPAAAPRVRLSWASRFNSASLARHVGRYPGYNWWNPQSGEYLLGEPWRHRREIATVLEVSGKRSRSQLLERLIRELTSEDVTLLMASDHEWYSHTRLYRELGFSELERIIYYQLNGLEAGPRTRRPLPELQFIPLGWANLDAAVQIDHAAFPWLWWNSEGEFAFYMGVPGVQAWLGLSGGKPVAYAGFTAQGGWGHLDRIAVDPAAQQKSLGAAMLAHALRIMSHLGVSRVTLSTQSDNYNAHRLYEGFGFQQTNNSQLIVGRWLNERGQ